MEEHLSVSILRLEARAHRHAGRLDPPALGAARIAAAAGDTRTEPLKLLIDDATTLVSTYAHAAEMGPEAVDTEWAEVMGERWRAVREVAGQLLGECLAQASNPAHGLGDAQRLWERLGPLVVRTDLPFTEGI